MNHMSPSTPSTRRHRPRIRAQVKNAFTYSLCLATLLFLPIWVQHLTAADGGLTAVGGGKISQEEIFGKTNKKGVNVGGYPPLMFHCLAIIGNTARVIALVEAGIDVNVQNRSGETPPHLAARHGHVRAMAVPA